MKAIHDFAKKEEEDVNVKKDNGGNDRKANAKYTEEEIEMFREFTLENDT